MFTYRWKNNKKDYYHYPCIGSSIHKLRIHFQYAIWFRLWRHVTSLHELVLIVVDLNFIFHLNESMFFFSKYFMHQKNRRKKINHHGIIRESRNKYISFAPFWIFCHSSDLTNIYNKSSNGSIHNDSHLKYHRYIANIWITWTENVS